MRKALSFVRAIFAAGALVLAAPAFADYGAAQRHFRANFDLADRLLVQTFLVGAGYGNGVPTGDFSKRQYEAVQKFQADNGFIADGDLTPPQFEKLIALARPWFQSWGFRKIFHPSRNIPLWIPAGLGLREMANDAGSKFEDPVRRVSIDFNSFAATPIPAAFALMTRLYEEKGAHIHYKVMKDGWFVISASTPDGVDHYLRYHQDGRNVTGFALLWNNANGDVHGERIAVLMSGALWATMTGGPAIDLPAPKPDAPKADAPKADAPKPETPKPAPPPAASAKTAPPAREPDKDKFSTGTGFFISADGHFVTSAHVIAECASIKAKAEDGAILDAKVVARDAINDLAVLKVDKLAARAAPLRANLRLGENVAAFGFPHADILATSGNFTLGNVTALSGIGDDSRFAQISTPVQAGNSGGPLLDRDGNVVGIVAAKLNALKLASEGGDLPQNVNFAVKTTMLVNFLDANRIAYLPATAAEKPLEPADLADRAKAMSLFIACK